MKLLENEAKGIMESYGISVPKSATAQDPQGVGEAYRQVGGSVVVKPLGIKRRAKAGLIAFASSGSEAAGAAARMAEKLGGKAANGFIIEQKMPVEKELYIGITIDYALGRPVLLLSPDGGIDIEQAAKGDQNRVRRIQIDITKGLDRKETLDALNQLGFPDPEATYGVVERMYRIFRDYGADTIEINPLAISGGKPVALDAVLSIDDDSLSKHPDLLKLHKSRKYKTKYEEEMGEQGWAYIDLDGNIGMISSGAGLSMSTLDLIQMHGGRAANFLDMAQVDGKGIARGLEIISTKPGVKVVLINLVAGLNRCDSMAEGVKSFVAANPNHAPVVVRMVGNRSDEGTAVLREAGLDNVASLGEAVDKAIALARG
jgi:succinyl-CoA synthetase beta subunit